MRCAISPDCRLVATTSSDRTVKLWSVGSWQHRATLSGHQRWVWDVAWSADSAYVVTASSDTTARLWDVRSKEAVRIYTGHSLAVTCVALNDSAA